MIGDEKDELDNADAAFVHAKSEASLYGDVLRKFSLSRKQAADKMGWVNPMRVPGRRALLETTWEYPGIFADVNIVLWLCTLKDASEFTGDDYRAGAFNPDMALNRPEEAIAKARAWLEEKGVSEAGDKPYVQARNLYFQIVFGIEASAFELKLEETGGPPLDELPKTKPGNPKRRSSSPGSHAKPATIRNSSGKR